MKLLGKNNSDILGVTMPGFGTTDRTYQNAIDLMKSLGVTIKEISIKDACVLHMKDIEHDSLVKDITYENTQARERTQILFDLANKHGKLLVGTGDLSELAMGWCTYNGDPMSMYGVNASVPKTLVKYLVEYVANVSDKKTADILYDVLDTPVSPELLPPDENGNIAQKTEDNIGPYELHDFFLYNFVRFGFEKNKIKRLALKAFDGKYDENTISKWLTVFTKRFLSKRSVPVFLILRGRFRLLFHSVREGIGECRVTHRLMCIIYSFRSVIYEKNYCGFISCCYDYDGCICFCILFFKKIYR